MIELRSVTVKIGGFALPNISFKVAKGAYAVLMGKTGVGKTTILEAICGLRKVVGGTVLVSNTDVTRWSPSDRQLGYVPQDLALFPTLNVAEQIHFPMKLRKVPAAERTKRTDELAELLGIGDLLRRRVQGLSGGEAQRVALARALSFRPNALLLDEPLSALDHETRSRAQEMLRSLNQTLGVTVLHVTHNPAEAEALADQKLFLEHTGETTHVRLGESAEGKAAEAGGDN